MLKTCFLSLYVVFLALILVILVFSDRQKWQAEIARRDGTGVEKTESDTLPPFVMILCNDGSAAKGGHGRHKFETQLLQAEVLIKSAVTLSHSNLKFTILGNNASVLPALERYVGRWKDSVRRRVHLSYRPVGFPAGWRLASLYENCVTQKLFLPWALPELDSVMYLDTDHVFMRPPEHLARHFALFDEQQVLGAAPVDGFYLQFNTMIPYYGPQGLSSALLLANLTRWRRLPFQWEAMVASVAQTFREGVIGDQAIFNIVFSGYPHYIYDLSCDWSGSIEQCVTANWNCSSIEKTGFSLVHGARHRFFPDQFGGDKIFSVPMHEIFESWRNHQPGQPVSLLLQQLTQKLRTKEEEIRKERNNNRMNQFCLYSFENLLLQLKNYVQEYESPPKRLKGRQKSKSEITPLSTYGVPTS